MFQSNPDASPSPSASVRTALSTRPPTFAKLRAPVRTPAAIRLVAALILAVGLPRAALASPASDLAEMKKSIAAMKGDYDRRIGALEDQLHATQAALANASGAPTSAPALASAAAPSGASAAVGGAATQVVGTSVGTGMPPDAVGAQPAASAVSVDTRAAIPTSGPTGSANAFNPSISLILSGLYAHTSRDPANYRLTGFALAQGAEAGIGSRGFSLAESELALAANIDPYLAGNINLSIGGDGSISAEEAYITTTTLPDGLVLKAGRFFSGVGYLNSQHSHTWDFVDNPLAYQAMLGTQYADDGLQLHWLAPTDQYMEFGLELGRGRSFPGNDSSRNAAGMSALTFHTGGDVGESNSWRAGLSVLQASARGQALADVDREGNAVVDNFTGRSRVWVADGVWKWAPNGNATRTYFKLQGEYLQSRRSGDLAVDDGAFAPVHSIQSGGYVQGVWQFEPQWRVGVRTERLDPGHADYSLNGASLAASTYRPTKNSLMLDFNPSEFSRIRLQLAQDKSRQGFTDNQVLLQYQTSLGAHGAHAY